jgi:hypothetical protein
LDIFSIQDKRVPIAVGIIIGVGIGIGIGIDPDTDSDPDTDGMVGGAHPTIGPHRRVGWALPTIHHWITDIFFNLELVSRDFLCYSRRMNETQRLQGRLISPENIEQIRALMIENPTWYRTRLIH